MQRDRPAFEAPALRTIRLIVRQPWRHCVTSLRSAHWLASSLKLAALSCQRMLALAFLLFLAFMLMLWCLIRYTDPADIIVNAGPCNIELRNASITQHEFLQKYVDSAYCDCDIFCVVFPSVFSPLPSNRHHRSNDDCLECKRENYQVRSVQYCVQQLCTVQCTHVWTDLTCLWIGFCLTGPISLCLA